MNERLTVRAAKRIFMIYLIIMVALGADPSGGPVSRLTVQPMAAPKPALKYMLLPDVAELKSGNPAQWYIRCFQEQRIFFFSKEATAERARYLAMPLAELPVEKLRNYGGSALTQADWAARLDAIDWQALQRIQAEGSELTLPEPEPLRILGMALRVRFRAEIAERRFDDAIRTCKTMFGLARHLGEYPADAANRAGLSIANLAVDSLEELIQQPGAPNLYWALSDLPSPLVEIRKGAQGSGCQVTTELRLILDDAPMSDADVEKAVTRLSGIIGLAREQAGQPPRNLRTALAARIKDEERVRLARARLVESGCAEKLAASFSPSQIILFDEKRACEARRHEGLKLLGQPFCQLGNASAKTDSLLADLLPNIAESRRAQGRLEQRLAALRQIEALRLYAAEHDGKLPAKLAEAGVALPDDPFTGKPFRYEADGTIARVEGEGIRFEVTIKK
jgi:hypothetical protein